MSTIIIGGGLTGLVAAEQLQRAGQAPLVLEREDEPGGCCRSLRRDGFIFDLTGHLLHVARPETRSYLQDLGVWEQLVVHERQAAVVVGAEITPYPIQINTHGLAPQVRRDCLLGFIKAWADRGVSDADSDLQQTSFREWVLDRFGEGLAHHFFYPYNRKLYRAEPEELSLDWVGRYVPKPKLEDVVDGAFGLYREPVGYNATFRYPEQGGICLLPDIVAGKVEQLRLQTEVTAIHQQEGWLEQAGGERTSFDRLISTISLPQLLDRLAGKVPAQVTEARRHLRWVRVVNLALGVAGAAPQPHHWLYYPDPELPFYRIGIPSNHGQVAPPGCHTLSVEVSLDPGTGDVEAVAAAAEVALLKIGMVDPQQVKVRLISVVDPAYVVFDHHRSAALSILNEYLAEQGIILAGRWAEWKYSAMEDAVLDGMAAAQTLLNKSTGVS
jgi:protoporphyrinogen oxidase